MNETKLVFYDDYKEEIIKCSGKSNIKENASYAVFEESNDKNLNKNVNEMVLNKFVTPTEEYINSFKRILNEESDNKFYDSLIKLDPNLLITDQLGSKLDEESFFKHINF